MSKRSPALRPMLLALLATLSILGCKKSGSTESATYAASDVAETNGVPATRSKQERVVESTEEKSIAWAPLPGCDVGAREALNPRRISSWADWSYAYEEEGSGPFTEEVGSCGSARLLQVQKEVGDEHYPDTQTWLMIQNENRIDELRQIGRYFEAPIGSSGETKTNITALGSDHCIRTTQTINYSEQEAGEEGVPVTIETIVACRCERDHWQCASKRTRDGVTRLD